MVSAHVADQPFLSTVIGEWQGAVAALTDMAASWALQRTGEAAAVQKKDDLFALGEFFLHMTAQRVRKDGGASLLFLSLNPHVDDTDDG